MARFLFVHGWGYDAKVWDPVRAHLPGMDSIAWDLGYFGHIATPAPPPAPYVAVGHSFGVMRLLSDWPAGAAGLVAVNGFARFTAGADFPEGVPRRLLDRMIARFAQDPSEVTADFRLRCGGPADPVAGLDVDRAARDLRALRDADERAAARNLRVPVLALSGDHDPIVSEAMTRASLGHATRVERLPGGHLLPLTDPSGVATRLAAFAEVLG